MKEEKSKNGKNMQFFYCKEFSIHVNILLFLRLSWYAPVDILLYSVDRLEN